MDKWWQGTKWPLAPFTTDQPSPPDIIISNFNAQKSELHGDEEIQPIVREKDGKKGILAAVVSAM